MLNGLGWGWREFEDGLYDVPANANGSIGREAFQEYVKLGGTPQMPMVFEMPAEPEDQLDQL